jgi:hypothetical protein
MKCSTQMSTDARICSRYSTPPECYGLRHIMPTVKNFLSMLLILPQKNLKP